MNSSLHHLAAHYWRGILEVEVNMFQQTHSELHQNISCCCHQHECCGMVVNYALLVELPVTASGKLNKCLNSVA